MNYINEKLFYLCFALILATAAGACGPKTPIPVSADKSGDELEETGIQDEVFETHVDKDVPAQIDEKPSSDTDGEDGASTSLSDEPIDEPVPVVERDPDVDFTTIGCILPMSGRSRLVGETVLKGVRMGARALSIGDNVKLTVSVQDSGSDPEKSAEAVEKLVEEKRVVAIVGPMDGTAAEAAAIRAEELGVPLLLFSVQKGPLSERRFSFREFPTNQNEIAALALAAEQSGKSKLAVFFPKSGYGRTMKNLMVEEAKRVGLDFAGAFSYDPKNSSFVEATSKLAGLEFDSLFIPDAASRIALLAPALASAGLWSAPSGTEPEGPGRAIQLLIPSAGASRDLPRRAGRYLNGALFASFLNRESSLGSADFIKQFELEHGVEPNFLSGYGHDAVLLVVAAIRSGVKNREELSDWLREARAEDVRGIPLAVPFGGFSPDGEPLAGPWILQLLDSEFVALR